MWKFCSFFTLIFLLYSRLGFGSCSVADERARLSSLSQALPVYVNCALQNNDDETQLYLARIYEKGQGDVAKNLSRSLLFYHLGSENGNASAMVGLSQLLTKLDSDEETRSEIPQYLLKINQALTGKNRNSFTGQILHPYALLALAAEGPENKWFYLTKTKTDSRAATLLKQYDIDPETKKQALQNATKWKQRKMLDVAREVLTVQEYNRFYNTLYPKDHRVDAFERSQAVRVLQEKVEKRL